MVSGGHGHISVKHFKAPAILRRFQVRPGDICVPESPLGDWNAWPRCRTSQMMKMHPEEFGGDYRSRWRYGQRFNKGARWSCCQNQRQKTAKANLNETHEDHCN